MNSFITIKKDTNPDLNFWELNPHLIYVKPFSQLYKSDKSKGKVESSKTMWCIVWMTDPDEDVNRYYRLQEDLRMDTCKEFHPKFNDNDPLTKECWDAYPVVCLTTIERVLKEEKEFLIKRSEFLRSQEYNFDTMKALDEARSKSKKLMEDYEITEKKFVEAKQKDVRIHGNRQQTAREKGRIKPTDNE